MTKVHFTETNDPVLNFEIHNFETVNISFQLRRHHLSPIMIIVRVWPLHTLT